LASRSTFLCQRTGHPQSEPVVGKTVARPVPFFHIEWRVKPGTVRVDNGPEHIREKMTKWAEKHGGTIQHIQPGQPLQNAYVERYNGTVRHERLDQYIIESIEGAQDHSTQ
jgi:putative transposase